MKRSIFVILALFIMLIAAACSRAADSIMDITAQSIEKIKVSTSPELFSPVELSDMEEIEKVVGYLTELSIGGTLHSEAMGGMAYVIEIINNDKTILEVVLFGNSAIEVDGKSYAFTSDGAAAFDTVIGEILLNRYRVVYNGAMIAGSVLSVDSDSSGRSVAAVIQTNDDKEILVDLSALSGQILDISGSGWMILHTGDEVKIGLDSNLVADRVFITKAAMQ